MSRDRAASLLARGPGGRRFVWFAALLIFLGNYGRFLDAITFAGGGDDLGVMQEAVDDGSGGGHVTQQFAPFFQRAIAGHDDGNPSASGTSFITLPRLAGGDAHGNDVDHWLQAEREILESQENP